MPEIVGGVVLVGAPTGAGPTIAVGADVTAALPVASVAVMTMRIVWFTSPEPSVSVRLRPE